MVPYSLRKALGVAITMLPISGWDALAVPVNRLFGNKMLNSGDKAHKLATRLGCVRDLDDLYNSLVSEWQDPALIVRGNDGKTLLEPRSFLDESLLEGKFKWCG